MSRWGRLTAVYVLVSASLTAFLGGCTVRSVSGKSQPAPVQSGTAPAAADGELDRIRTAVEAALDGAPLPGYAPIPDGVRLRTVARRDSAIVLDFNAALLAGGTGRVLEDSLHQIFTAASRVRPPVANRVDDYRVLVDGLPLETYLR